MDVKNESSVSSSRVWSVVKIILIIIIVVLIFTVGYSMLSPFFGMLKNLFGIFDSALSSVNKQFEVCARKGWFSTDCGIGIGAIVAGGVWLLLTIGTLVVQYKSSNKSIETAKAETGKTGAELCKEMIDKTGINDIDSLKEKMKESGKFTDEQINDVNIQTAFLEGVATNFSTNETIKAVKNQSMSPSAMEDRIKALIEEALESRNASIEELNEEDGEAVEDAANEIEPVVDLR
jgi:hypothetical protein